MQFPYGTAPLAILILALLSGLGIMISSARSAPAQRPDLVMAIFAKDHVEAYKPVIARFEKEHNVKIQLQLVDQRALQSRLQSSLLAGAEVPDIVELLDGTMGVFTKGPLEDIGFIDLTDRIKAAELDKKLVTSRFSKWSSRGRIFGLPHDVHPIMLAYRRDLCEQLGIDVTKLTTWEEFVRVGREITRDGNGDGVIDRYMIDFQSAGSDNLKMILMQAGESLLDADGNPSFDTPGAAEVAMWYARQTTGPTRISFDAGWGQTLSRAFIDGLCLFYVCPDWRSRAFMNDIPSLSGKVGLIPLPAWKPGGIRTSTWGATGLAITKATKHPDLAWKLAQELYFNESELGHRFLANNILPPLRSAWKDPAFDTPFPFYANQAIGRDYANLADQVPAENVTAYSSNARDKFSEAYTNVSLYYDANGDKGLREYALKELKRTADQVRERIARNPFLKTESSKEVAQ